MTKAQRRKKSRLAPQNHATGPKTEAGKEASRRSALTHGLTAKVLTLPGEDPNEIQARADKWHEACQPQGHAEEAVVDQVALASLRLERIAKAHNEIIAEQVRTAEPQWELRQELRVLKYRRLLRRDRATAILKLRSFGAGVVWLLGRWKLLEAAFNASQCWKDLAQIREAVTLRSLRDDKFGSQVGSEYEFAVVAASCVEDHRNRPELAHFLANYDEEGSAAVGSPTSMKKFMEAMASYLPDEYLSRNGVRPPSLIEARRTMRSWIDRQIADLRELDRQFREIDAQSRAGAKVRAMAPADTPRNRLLLRYKKSAESAFDRSLKTLAKLQRDREKAAETDAKRDAAEARKTNLPNEPAVVGKVRSNELVPGSCVRLQAKDYVVQEKSDGNLILSQIDTTIQSQPREVAATPENGV